MQLDAKQEMAPSPVKKAAAPAKTATEEKGKDEVVTAAEEDVLAELKGKKNNKSSFFMLLAPIVIIVAVLLVLMIVRSINRSKPPEEAPQQSSEVVEQNQTSQGTAVSSSSSEDTSVPGVGTQDFTKNTNMTSSSVMTNPNQYLEDLYGLTTSVEYNVREIKSATDFVSYTKYRGTWGGGLELYWLNVDYKGRAYVIQVPFKYYKELTDTGIVPVKMEVLKIRGSADEDLTVISYMALDEETLASVLKTQAK